MIGDVNRYFVSRSEDEELYGFHRLAVYTCCRCCVCKDLNALGANDHDRFYFLFCFLLLFEGPGSPSGHRHSAHNMSSSPCLTSFSTLL